MATPRPTQTGYVTFIRDTMKIDDTVLPDDDSAIEFSYEYSLQTVNQTINSVSPFMYVQAVYNLAGDILVNVAQDQTGNDYFTTLRAEMHLGQFVAGVISSSGDNGTSQGMVVPQAFSNFTLGDLQNLKTPWGRAYLTIAQKTGSMWGLT